MYSFSEIVSCRTGYSRQTFSRDISAIPGTSHPKDERPFVLSHHYPGQQPYHTHETQGNLDADKWWQRSVDHRNTHQVQQIGERVEFQNHAEAAAPVNVSGRIDDRRQVKEELKGDLEQVCRVGEVRLCNGAQDRHKPAQE